MLPHPSGSPNLGKMPIRVVAKVFDLLFYIISARVFYIVPSSL
jgi:hypothetical protein